MSLSPKSFLKKYIGVFDDAVYTTLDTWVRGTDDFKSGEDMLLQMDIEGGEYLSLLGVSEQVLKRFRIMVIEIHDVENWGDPRFFQMVSTFFDKITRHFWVVHNHPNIYGGQVNLGGFVAPQVFELTLLRKDRANPQGYCDQFPHPLDRPNNPDGPDLVLAAPMVWRSASGLMRPLAPPRRAESSSAIKGLCGIESEPAGALHGPSSPLITATGARFQRPAC